MTSGVVIRLKNLPLSAGTIDIRHFFGGLRIPDGGVHIIGGDDGTAFILFSTDEDARRAMLQDGQDLSGAKIRLMLSSHTEMKTVIEQSQRICEELRGKRPPEPPITNLSTRSTASSFKPPKRHYQTKPPSPKITADMLDPNDVHVEIKGMPFSVSQADIILFFSPLSVVAIRFMLDEKGRKNGTGFVKFGSAMDKIEGLKRDRKYIGSRFVKLSSATERQWLLASSQGCETVRPGSDSTSKRKRTQAAVSPNDSTPKRSRDFSPLRSDNCVEVRGLPSSATFKVVSNLFSHLHYVENGMHVEMDGSVCKGTAYVEFRSYTDYKEALSKDGDMVNGKQVRVIGLSKQNMVEQIRRHKKYSKAKKEELSSREKAEQEKKSKVDLKKKKDHQLRKQREMDEWLRRQHEKEERDRKRRDLEKQILSQKAKERKSREINPTTVPLNDIKSKGNDHRSNDVKDIVKKEIMDEPVSGAGEMDIEDDSNDNEVVHLPKTEDSIQQNLVNATTSYGFPTVLGTSGNLISSSLAINFNPAIPVINPAFALPNMAQLPSNLHGTLPGFSSPGLMLAKTPFINTSQPAIMNTPPLPPPPLPSVLMPPPTPPTVIPVSIPSLSQDPIPSNAISGTSRSIQQFQTSEPVVDSEYVRIANSPYTVRESDVREFFQGLTIPEHGIQFINRPSDDRRTGHIFVKFLNKDDAAKAAFKDDQVLRSRNVLVKVATFKTLSQIYEKVTKGLSGPYVPTFDGPSTAQSVTVTEHGDSFFTKRILSDKMTCVCIGNLPPMTLEKDVVNLLGDIKYVPNRIIVLRDSDGKCKGDVYVQLQSPEECVKAANLHGNTKIRGEVIRVLPLSVHAMEKDLEGRQDKTIPPDPLKLLNSLHSSGVQLNLPQPNGALGNLSASNGAIPVPESVFGNVVPNTRFPPPALSGFVSFDGKHHAFNPRVPPPNMAAGDLFKPPGIDTSRPPALCPSDMVLPPPPKIPEDILRMAVGPGRDKLFGFPSIPPPPLGAPLPMVRPPFSVGSKASVKTILMSNLSFKVTREDILEFFSGFDPLPDSVRLMYNNTGKPTGDGVVSFPNVDVARAAVERRNSCPLLARKIKLSLQQ